MHQSSLHTFVNRDFYLKIPNCNISSQNQLAAKLLQYCKKPEATKMKRILERRNREFGLRRDERNSHFPETGKSDKRKIPKNRMKSALGDS